MERYWEEINLLYNSDESMKNAAVSLDKGGGGYSDRDVRVIIYI